MAAIHKKTSHYTKTAIKDFYLDLWEPVDVPETSNDTKYVIESKYHKRPDSLSYDLYGSSRLWWVFAMRNKNTLIDPVDDFTSGTTIYIPSKESVESF